MPDTIDIMDEWTKDTPHESQSQGDPSPITCHLLVYQVRWPVILIILSDYH